MTRPVLQAEARTADAVVQCSFKRSSRRRRGLDCALCPVPANHSFIRAAVALSPISPWANRPSVSLMRRRRVAPLPEKAARVAIDRLVLAAAGIRSVVLCNAMIYGHALGPPAQSVQIPALVRQAKASGVVRYIGRGLNRWSNVHIADVAALVCVGARQGTRGHIHVCREWRGGAL